MGRWRIAMRERPVGVVGATMAGGRGQVRDCEVVVWLDGQVVESEVRGLAGLSDEEAAAVADELEQVARRIRSGWTGRVVVH